MLTEMERVHHFLSFEPTKLHLIPICASRSPRPGLHLIKSSIFIEPRFLSNIILALSLLDPLKAPRACEKIGQVLRALQD